jgi:hypothetical protein
MTPGTHDRLPTHYGEAAALIVDLRDELEDQWSRNHAEHCDIIWPHKRGETCEYPPPVVIVRASEWLGDLCGD